MKIVGAYVEIPPRRVPPFDRFNQVEEVELLGDTPSGLSVEWPEGAPDNAQVYLSWVPKVHALWNEDVVDYSAEETEDAEGDTPGDD